MARAEGLTATILKLDGEIAVLLERCVVAMEQVCEALQGWAKAEHSYTDRTSNNTNSIRAFVAEATPALVRGILTAGMEYSVFLELARDGRWAFLLPVIERHEADILHIIETALSGSTSGAIAQPVALPSNYEAYKTDVRESRQSSK